MTAVAIPEDRAAIRKRLQSLIREIEQRPVTLRPRVIDDEPPSSLTWLDSAESRVGFRELRYSATDCVGEQSLAPLFEVTPETLRLISRGNEEIGRPGTNAEDLVFFDIETTGLGGAGATVFMVALARVEGGELVLRQFVSPSPADEAALIDAVVETILLPRDPVLVTYNGITFDAPFVDERATMHRRRAGLQSARHLDLLHTVRRGYRGVLPSHRLAVAEAELLRVTRPSLEVGGAEIPSWYFRFVRSGSMRFLDPLLHHNAVDVLSLAGLVAHLQEGFEIPGSPVRALALGRLAITARDLEGAEARLRIAASALSRPLLRADAVRDLAATCRSLGRRSDVLTELEWLVTHSPTHAEWAREQLAIHYEHSERDHSRALALIAGCGNGPRWVARRKRLERKVQRMAP